MSINIFDDPKIQALIDHFGGSRKMAIFVGAASSIEAGLPSWETFVQRLLDRAAADRKLFSSAESREEWVTSMLRVESLMGAASVVEGLLGDELGTVATEELFRHRKPPHGGRPTAPGVTPGQIALQVASLREAFDDHQQSLKIYTTNYDGLLEKALRSRTLLRNYDVYPYVGPGDPEPAKPLKVRHLHGYLGDERAHTPIVLTERSYFGKDAEDDWQTTDVVSHLSAMPSLFLGTSLTDLNLIRYLYRGRGNERHAVVFVRQAELYTVPESVRKVREDVAADRWDNANVDVVFVDHYSDVAQLIAEISRKRENPELYTPLPSRAERYFAPLRRTVLRTDVDRERFIRNQTLLNETLVDILTRTTEALAKNGIDLTQETGLALTLWLLDSTGQYLVSWASTDRVHCQESGLQVVRLEPRHRFVASRAYCSGTYQEDNRNFRNSRWSYIVGIPLWTNASASDLGRIPIGAMTLMTQTAAAETRLASLEPTGRAVLASTLAVATLTRLDDLRAQP